MIELILRRLFPWTVKFIEFKARGKAIDDWAENIIAGKPDYSWIYQNDGGTYKLGVIEKTNPNDVGMGGS